MPLPETFLGRLIWVRKKLGLQLESYCGKLGVIQTPIRR